MKSDRYIPLRDLRNLSGIGWDELRQRVVASDEFWEGLKRNEVSSVDLKFVVDDLLFYVDV